MTQHSLTEKLAKANDNIAKLCEYFATRRDWLISPDSEPVCLDLSKAAGALGVQIRTMMQACGTEPDDPVRPEIESIGDGTHDEQRLQRFAAFLRDLETWFAAQTDTPTDDAAIAALRDMESHVVCMISIFDTTIANSKETEQVDAPASASDDEGATAPPPQSIVTDGTGKAITLVLDDTDEHPLIQEFQGIQELTPECEKLADDFLAAWNIEFSYYSRKKFLERLLRWISSAPDGQVLVIKMKTLEEPYEPYPSYVSRDVLNRKEPPQES
jgi:hypothetical protein